MKTIRTTIAAALVASLGLSLAAPAFAAAGSSHGASAARDGADTERTGTPDRESADGAVDARGIFAIENATEAIAEHETTGRAAIVAARASVGMWLHAQERLAANGASQRDLARASASVEALDAALLARSDLARPANAVTAALAPLFSLAGDRTPAAIHTLDYLGREITLDVRAADLRRAAIDARTLRATWDAVRPSVLARSGGPLAAARYERGVLALERAVSARDDRATTIAAKATLDGVDALEKTYVA